MVLDARTSRPYWLEEAAPDPVAPPLERDTAADVAIVGGGYTGGRRSRSRSRDPDLHVVLVERDVCGHGPSGRNGAFLHGYWSRLPLLRERFGDAGALAVARAADGTSAVRSVGDDVWLVEGGMVKVAAAAAQEPSLDQLVAAARAVEEPDEAVPLSKPELDHEAITDGRMFVHYFSGSRSDAADVRVVARTATS